MRLLAASSALFRRLEQSVVSAAQLRLQVSPGALKSADRRTGLFDVMDPILVKDLFEIAAEARSLQRLCQEVALQCLVFQMIADFGEALLAIQERADEFARASSISFCFPASVDMETSISVVGEHAVGAGSAGCARFSSASGKQEKSRKSHAPANRFQGPPGHRRQAASLQMIDARNGRGFAFGYPETVCPLYPSWP